MVDPAQILVSHAVDLSAYSNSVVRSMLALLAKVDQDLLAQLIVLVSDMPASEFKMARLLSMMKEVGAINEAGFAKLGRELTKEMSLLAAYEAEFAETTLRAIGGKVARTISPAQVASAAIAQPMRGRLLSQWAENLSARRIDRIQTALAISYVEGKTIGDMVRMLRGTRAGAYRDGLIVTSRREAETVVRTAVSHYAAEARKLSFSEHSDLIESVTWLSTLDTRTSDYCRPRDGLKYTPDGKPLGHSFPWLGGPGEIHWNCRSVAVPNLKGIDRSRVPRQRASMDGPVGGGITYEKWLRAQPVDRQNEVLGRSRAILFRAGKYTLDRFYNNKGRHLTLAELRDRDSKTFERLGL